MGGTIYAACVTTRVTSAAGSRAELDVYAVQRAVGLPGLEPVAWDGTPRHGFALYRIAPSDPDSGDSVEFWRIYRWTGTGPGFPSGRYDLVGAWDDDRGAFLPADLPAQFSRPGASKFV